jgi:uncharacterized protein YggL (DUF469 family)
VTYVDNAMRAAPAAFGHSRQLGAQAFEVEYERAGVAAEQVAAFVADFTDFVVVVDGVAASALFGTVAGVFCRSDVDTTVHPPLA